MKLTLVETVMREVDSREYALSVLRNRIPESMPMLALTDVAVHKNTAEVAGVVVGISVYRGVARQWMYTLVNQAGEYRSALECVLSRADTEEPTPEGDTSAEADPLGR